MYVVFAHTYTENVLVWAEKLDANHREVIHSFIRKYKYCLDNSLPTFIIYIKQNKNGAKSWGGHPRFRNLILSGQ
jgi:hypothetical protein